MNIDSKDTSNVQGDDSTATITVHDLAKKSVLHGTSCNQKCKKMLNLSQKLATLSCQYGMPEFWEKYALTDALIHPWEHNFSFSLVPNSDNSVQLDTALKDVFANETENGQLDEITMVDSILPCGLSKDVEMSTNYIMFLQAMPR